MSVEKPIQTDETLTTEQRNPALERFLWTLLIVILVGVSGVAAWKLWSARQTQSSPAAQVVVLPPSGPLGVVSDFSLVDQNGNAVTLGDLKGKVWVANFFWTHCPGKCPMMTQRMGTLQSALPQGADARLVSITVDPKSDSPEVLKEYAQRFGAKDERWLFLTGDLQAIIRLAREGFHLNATENPNDHELRLVLVDRDARIRGYFDLDEESVAKLRRQLN